MWVFYNPKYSLYDKTVEEWTSILELANEWSFVEVKNLAVRELEKLEIDPIEKVYIYHRFNISRSYLVVSYAAIVTRQSPLNLVEGRKLGLDTSLKIAEGRERLREQVTQRLGVRSPGPEDFETKDVDQLVRELFEVPTRPPGGPTNGRQATPSDSRPSSPPTNPGSPPPLRTQVTGEYNSTQSPKTGTNGNGSLMGNISSLFGNGGTPTEDKTVEPSPTTPGEPSLTSVMLPFFVAPSNINSFVSL